MTNFKSILTFLLAGSLSLTASAYSKIGISFNRTGTNAGSVTTTVVDENGKPISGANATVTSSHNFKATASSVTASMICFDVNGNTSPTITFSVAITGLTESVTFSEVGIDIHALNGSSNYQQNGDSKSRKWNVALSQNEAAFATLSNIDIAAGVGKTGNVHQFWSLEGQETSATESLTLNFTISANSASNVGCFFGLTDITIGGNERIEPNTTTDPDPKPEINEFGGDSRYYNIVWKTDGSYMTETGGGVLQVESKSNVSKQYWQFLPTGKENCYYIQNAVTKRYIEACKTNQNNTYNISTVDTPVEYYISPESAQNGAYRLTSTNCSNYNDTSKSPVGLNKNGANSYIITWAAGTSNSGSYWYINETDFDYDFDAAIAATKHTDFAKSAQVYFMPCGSTYASYYAKALKVTGEGVVKELDYPCTTWGGSSKNTGTPNSSSYYHLYTTDKGHVVPGKELEVQVSLQTLPTEGYMAQVCFDWNRDGEFEEVQTIDEFTSKDLVFRTTVPEDAKLGESRLRFRLTINGMVGADDEVAAGQILDCQVIAVAEEEAKIIVATNDPNRGSAWYDETEEKAKAIAVGDAKFLCWLEGKKVVSTNAEYAVKAECPRRLMAMFSANTTDERPTGIHALSNETSTLYTEPIYFNLQGIRVNHLVKGETYICKDQDNKGQIIIF